MAGLHSNDSLRCLPACLLYYVRRPACLCFRLLVPRSVSSGLYVSCLLDCVHMCILYIYKLSAGHVFCQLLYIYVYVNCLLVL